jgi:hypothetical protein
MGGVKMIEHEQCSRSTGALNPRNETTVKGPPQSERRPFTESRRTCDHHATTHREDTMGGLLSRSPMFYGVFE